MKMLPPTPRQRQVERFILQYIEDHDGVSSAQHEIAAGCKMSIQSANQMLARMIERGRITRDRTKQRSIQLVA